MNKLQIFNSKEFGTIRTIKIGNKPFLCLIDICNVLDIKNTSQIKNRLNKDGVCTNEVIDSLGRKQIATFVDESNFYKVIFQSRKEEAERFTNWVTSEVLPAIRATGGYISGEENMSEDELVLKAMSVLDKKVKNLKKEISQKNEELEIQKHKVFFANAVTSTKNCISVNNLSKFLKQNGCDIGEKRMFEWLRNNGYLNKRKGQDYNTPTQRSMDLGLFVIKESIITKPTGEKFISKTSLVTGKGQVYLFNKYIESQN